MVREPDYGMRWSPAERTWGEYLDAAMLEGAGVLSGHRLRANIYIETFDCVGSTPFITYNGTAAGIVNTVGKGKGWLLGTFAGHNGTAYRDDATRRFILELLKQCGVMPEYNGKLLRRRRISGKKEAWLFTNPTCENITETVDVRGWDFVEDLLDEKLDIKDGFLNLIVKGLDVRVLILKK